MEQEAQERTEASDKERADNGGKHKNEAAKKRYKRAHTAIEKANPQYNWTDPDSKIMPDAATGGWVQAYNAQAAVNESQVIVAAEISNVAADRGQLTPMAHAVHHALGQMPEALLADAGYFSSEAFDDERLRDAQVLVSPAGGGERSRRAPKPANSVPGNARREAFFRGAYQPAFAPSRRRRKLHPGLPITWLTTTSSPRRPCLTYKRKQSIRSIIGEDGPRCSKLDPGGARNSKKAWNPGPSSKVENGNLIQPIQAGSNFEPRPGSPTPASFRRGGVDRL